MEHAFHSKKIGAGGQPLSFKKKKLHGAEHAANPVFVLTPRRKWRALCRIGAENLLSPRPMDRVALLPLLQDAVLGMLHHMSVLAWRSPARPWRLPTRHSTP